MSSHDTLVRRLSEMLFKLNQGERLDPAALAEEFGVNIRTIRRRIADGSIVAPYNTEGMYRGWVTPDGLVHVATHDHVELAGQA